MKNLDYLLSQLPPTVARKAVGTVFGGIIAPKTISNAESLGKGPEGKMRSGRTVFYETAKLLKWLSER